MLHSTTIITGIKCPKNSMVEKERWERSMDRDSHTTFLIKKSARISPGEADIIAESLINDSE